MINSCAVRLIFLLVLRLFILAGTQDIPIPTQDIFAHRLRACSKFSPSLRHGSLLYYLF